jgi:hypothetical protein
MAKRGINFASNINYKLVYTIAVLLLVAIIGLMVINAAGTITSINPGHNSTQVFIPIGNDYITLQDAIDYGYLLGVNITPVPITTINNAMPYELSSKILITISGKTMTLQEAIAHNVFVSGATASYTTTVPPGGELASKININTSGAPPNNIMTLQSAITTNINLLKNLMTYQWISGSWSGDGACPTTTYTRTVYCQRSDGAQVADNNCAGSKPATSKTTTCTWANQGSYHGLGCAPGEFYVEAGISYNQPGCSGLSGASCSPSGGTTYCSEGSCSCGYGCGGTTIDVLKCNINSP